MRHSAVRERIRPERNEPKRSRCIGSGRRRRAGDLTAFDASGRRSIGWFLALRRRTAGSALRDYWPTGGPQEPGAKRRRREHAQYPTQVATMPASRGIAGGGGGFTTLLLLDDSPSVFDACPLQGASLSPQPGASAKSCVSDGKVGSTVEGINPDRLQCQ